MRVAVEKIPGVEDVTVSLNEGMTLIRFARANRVTISQVRRAIREKGFTPGAADVRVTGTVELRGDTFVLVLPEPGPVLRLRVPASLRAALLETVGREVQVEGRSPEEREGGVTPDILELRSIRGSGE